jgi:exodeoxyribonuclease VII large subunit
MDRIVADGSMPDAVLILRGGGAKLDLACFDDYQLAAAIARYPMPVLTAIGHDQDFHVADMVAHAFVKTPTALADFFLDIYADEDARLSSYMTRMKMAFSSRLALMESNLNVLQARIMGADPRRILERGYTLVLDADGRVMKGAAGRSKGDRVTVMFADGRLDCTVNNVILSEAKDL